MTFQKLSNHEISEYTKAVHKELDKLGCAIGSMTQEGSDFIADNYLKQVPAIVTARQLYELVSKGSFYADSCNDTATIYYLDWH